MAEYHVGCGLFGIYAGILKNKTTWKDKSKVTEEVLGAAAQYLLENNKEITFDAFDKHYAMSVEEVKGGTE